MRFGTKDWQEYKDNLAAVNRALAEQDSALAEEHYAVMHREQARAAEYAARSGTLVRSMWRPWISVVSYQKASFEGFMDWLAAGKPKLAAKLHVKHL